MHALFLRPVRWVRSWELWALPRYVLMYVLVVDLLAVGVTAGVAALTGLSRTNYLQLAILIACAIVHVELSRSIDRTRELAAGSGPFVDSLTVWDFTAVIVLPATVACGVIVVTHTYTWLRVWRGRRPLYRWLFSDATVLLGTQAAAYVLLMGPGDPPGIPPGLVGLAVLVAAAAVRWFVNYALVVGAILASSPHMKARQVIGEFGDQLLEAGALGLGIAAAGLLGSNPLLLLGVVIGLIALHRGVLLAQFRRASRTDGKTSLHTAAWWHQIAQQAFTTARGNGNALAVLMLDIDHFKRINDSYGHLAGDDVLRTVADAISSEVRRYDVTGRWGGEEFAVVLADVDTTELRTIAERIRRRLHSIVVTVPTGRGKVSISGLTISIGGARYPCPGITTLDDLLLAADTALYAAKAEGRDRVHLLAGAPTNTTDSTAAGGTTETTATDDAGEQPAARDTDPPAGDTSPRRVA